MFANRDSEFLALQQRDQLPYSVNQWAHASTHKPEDSDINVCLTWIVRASGPLQVRRPVRSVACSTAAHRGMSLSTEDEAQQAKF